MPVVSYEYSPERYEFFNINESTVFVTREQGEMILEPGKYKYSNEIIRIVHDSVITRFTKITVPFMIFIGRQTENIIW